VFRGLLRGAQPAPGPAEQLVASSGSTATTGSGTANVAAGDTAAHSSSAAYNQNLARLSVVLSHPDWAVGTQWSDWVSLWNQESGWNNLALNPSSGAYGIPQALPASKMGAAANPPTSSAAAQIQWGIGYIAGRYGSPSAAWAHEKANNWY
jgi:hypothetical protein